MLSPSPVALSTPSAVVSDVHMPPSPLMRGAGVSVPDDDLPPPPSMCEVNVGPKPPHCLVCIPGLLVRLSPPGLWSRGPNEQQEGPASSTFTARAWKRLLGGVRLLLRFSWPR